MSETKKKTVNKAKATKATKKVLAPVAKNLNKISDKFKALAQTLANVELPKNNKRLWVEVSPEWIEAAKEVQKSK